MNRRSRKRARAAVATLSTQLAKATQHREKKATARCVFDSFVRGPGLTAQDYADERVWWQSLPCHSTVL